MASILLVEDHPIVREGVRAFLEKTSEHEVVAECEDGVTALQLVAEHRPDVVIVDLRIPRLDGLEVTRRVVHNYPSTRVVVLSMYSTDSYVASALRHGALAYVLKNSDIKELNSAIDSALAGQPYLSSALSNKVGHGIDTEDRYELLTTREREILQHVAEGMTAAAIAELLNISVRTVEKHRSNLMHKLGAKNHADVIRYALQRGLIPFTVD
jgi:two-component system, NarL family, response regulator NreC